ncbi:MAG: sporulation peptidase YabG, partial [Peptostreptococcaceae bacterium]|nr:sporulation peptidase YabG [Peptostreptococcaceae bacterium]
MRIGDIVARKSYNKDIIFKIEAFSVDENKQKIALLKGIAFRVVADAYLDDLEIVQLPDMNDILIDRNVENLLYRSVKKAKERQKKNMRGIP